MNTATAYLASVSAPQLTLPSAGSDDTMEQAKRRRNEAWEDCDAIPEWVNKENVELDRFFTRPEVALECRDSLYSVMCADYADVGRYEFVDPGAGTGAFYDLMPRGRRTGVDICSERTEFVSHDYLTWWPSASRPYAVLGNPPFGYRGWLSLAFINHSATFADYIGCIVPMAFQSDGKGSPKHRVIGAELILSQPLSPDSFMDMNGQAVKLNALWQIWRRGVNNFPPAQTCADWVDLFTVDHRKERLCGQNRIGDADWFLQRTYFGEHPTLVPDFASVRYGCGYGIVIKKDTEAITRILMNTDWNRYSNLALHNCRHISMYHIRQAVIDAGYVDG